MSKIIAVSSDIPSYRSGIAKKLLAELKSEIQNTIIRFCKEPAHRDTAVQAVTRKGFALHPQASCRAGVFTFEVCRSISGSATETALRAATAVELVIEAGFMFDNVADQEVDREHGLSASEELALAITILSCGTAVAYETVHHAGNGTSGLNPFMQLQSSCIAACGGQFLDAHLQKSQNATTDDSLRMTSLKAGSLGRLAAEFGASIATDDFQMVDLFGEFGFNLFTYLQLVDDLRDALPESGPNTDYMLGKKTLPLVFFYNSIIEAHAGDNDAIMRRELDTSVCDVRQKFDASGAWSFGAIVAETYLNRSKANLSDIKRQLETVDSLERLVNSIEITPQWVTEIP